MNFSSFDYFLALARERSYTRAADALHITQQSLSAAIAALERELGCPLVVRRTPLELTYAGRVFLQYAERFHQTRDEMQRTFCDSAASYAWASPTRAGGPSCRGSLRRLRACTRTCA